MARKALKPLHVGFRVKEDSSSAQNTSGEVFELFDVDSGFVYYSSKQENSMIPMRGNSSAGQPKRELLGLRGRRILKEQNLIKKIQLSVENSGKSGSEVIAHAPTLLHAVLFHLYPSMAEWIADLPIDQSDQIVDAILFSQADQKNLKDPYFKSLRYGLVRRTEFYVARFVSDLFPFEDQPESLEFASKHILNDQSCLLFMIPLTASHRRGTGSFWNDRTKEIVFENALEWSRLLAALSIGMEKAALEESNVDVLLESALSMNSYERKKFHDIILAGTPFHDEESSSLTLSGEILGKVFTEWVERIQSGSSFYEAYNDLYTLWKSQRALGKDQLAQIEGKSLEVFGDARLYDKLFSSAFANADASKTYRYFRLPFYSYSQVPSDGPSSYSYSSLSSARIVDGNLWKERIFGQSPEFTGLNNELVGFSDYGQTSYAFADAPYCSVSEICEMLDIIGRVIDSFFPDGQATAQERGVWVETILDYAYEVEPPKDSLVEKFRIFALTLRYFKDDPARLKIAWKQRLDQGAVEELVRIPDAAFIGNWVEELFAT